MNMFFSALKWSGSEGEFYLYCLYLPLLFLTTFILDFLFFAISAVEAKHSGKTLFSEWNLLFFLFFPVLAVFYYALKKVKTLFL